MRHDPSIVPSHRPRRLPIAVLSLVAVVLVAGCASDQTRWRNEQSDCANGGGVIDGGRRWLLVDDAPPEWQDVGAREGTLEVVDDDNAVFTAADGTVLRVATEATADCRPWGGEESTAAPSEDPPTADPTATATDEATWTDDGTDAAASARPTVDEVVLAGSGGAVVATEPFTTDGTLRGFVYRGTPAGSDRSQVVLWLAEADAGEPAGTTLPAGCIGVSGAPPDLGVEDEPSGELCADEPAAVDASGSGALHDELLAIVSMAGYEPRSYERIDEPFAATSVVHEGGRFPVLLSLALWEPDVLDDADPYSSFVVTEEDASGAAVVQLGLVGGENPGAFVRCERRVLVVRNVEAPVEQAAVAVAEAAESLARAMDC